MCMNCKLSCCTSRHCILVRLYFFLKAALIIVDDCCQTHKHRYEVTVYTGSRPGSGTTSSVCIILGGSNSESDPHCLSTVSEILFQRGGVDSFLVTSAEVGNYTCRSLNLQERLHKKQLSFDLFEK